MVREAIKVLSAKGLVEVRPKTGTRVRPRETWNLIDVDVLAWLGELGVDREVLLGILEVRAMLEPSSARLAARHVTASEIAELGEVVSALELASARIETDGERAREESLEADLAFHAGVIRACRNPILFQVHQTLALGLRTTQIHFPGNASTARYSVPLHRQLLDH